MENFNKATHKLLVTWFTIMLLQSMGRLLFFFDFLPEHFLIENSFWEVPYIFMMGLRFDLTIATSFLLPAFLFSLILFWKKINIAWWNRGFKVWSILVIALILLMIILNHFFYYYYHDLFNTFFWEFWLNWENSKLVIWSLFDEIPLIKLGVYASVIILFICLSIFLLKKLIPPLEQTYPFRRPAFMVVWFMAILFSGRGTFDRLPLAKQIFKGQISNSAYLNFTHSNPFYSLYTSWDKNFERSVALKIKLKNTNFWADAQNLFQKQTIISNNRIIQSPSPQQTALIYKVPSLSQQYLKKKPKHIVLLFMESYFVWPGKFEDKEFQQKVMGSFLNLKKKGIYFDQYFQAGAGTIENLTKVVLGIPTPRDSPHDITFTEAFKPFPGTMPRLMEKMGYLPMFFYGGSLAWHNLSLFMKKAGFKLIFGENSLHDAKKHRFGLNDEDLFRLVNLKLSEAKEPTFSFIMTLSNHPPYQLPEDYENPIKEIPVQLQDILYDRELFYKRFRAFSYSDRALNQFLQKAEKEKYFKDTLFVITADHTVHAPFNWEPRNEYQIAKIPLLFYAPDLLTPLPHTVNIRGTHFDLMPTLLSLIANQPLTIHHWGKSLFSDNTQDYLFSFYLDCLNDYCTYQNQNYQLNEAEEFTTCTDDKCSKKIKILSEQRQAFDLSGMFYFLNYNVNGLRP